MANDLIALSVKTLKEQTRLNREDNSETLPYIHYREIDVSKQDNDQEKLDEEKETIQGVLEGQRLPRLDWHDKNDNQHIGKDSKTISKVLKSTTPKITGDDKRDVEEYTGKTTKDQIIKGSGGLNRSLLNPRTYMGHRTYNLARRLHRVTSQPIGHDLSLYSGVRTDPRKWKQEKDGSTRLRGFTSMTHDKTVAHSFAHQWTHGQGASASGKKGEVHIIHLHAKAGDKGMYVSHHSPFNEHETVLPADTHIAPHPDHPKPDVHRGADGTRVFVHHYVIHKQTEGGGNYRPENPIA